MKKLIAIAFIAITLLSSTDAFAGYSRSSSYVSRSTTYSRPSYSRPSYSAPTPRSYSPSYRSAAPRNTTTINRNTTIHHDTSGGIAGNPFFWMWAFGNHGNQQPPQQIIVQPQAQPGIIGPAQEVMAAPQEDDGIGPMGVLALILAGLALVGILYARSNKDTV